MNIKIKVLEAKLIRVINSKGKVRHVSESLSKSIALKVQGYWIEEVPTVSQTFEGYEENNLPGVIKDGGDTDLLAAPQKAKPGPKKK